MCVLQLAESRTCVSMVCVKSTMQPTVAGSNYHTQQNTGEAVACTGTLGIVLKRY